MGKKLFTEIEKIVSLQDIEKMSKERSNNLPIEYDKFSYELGFNQAYHFILSQVIKDKKNKK